MFQVTQRLFPLCGQSSARIVQSSSSRVMSLTLGSASSTILSENTCLRDNFHHGRTIVPSVRFSTWRYYNYSPLNYFTTTALPITPFYRAPRFVTLVGDMNNNLNHAQQHEQTRGFATKKHKRVIKQSKGFRGRAKNCFRIAIRRLEKSWQYAYRDRKVKKREFRKLWIQRMNAGVRQYGISYSRYVQMQARSGVVLDRKILSGLAMYEPFSFKAVIDVVKKFGEAK